MAYSPYLSDSYHDKQMFARCQVKRRLALELGSKSGEQHELES